MIKNCFVIMGFGKKLCPNTQKTIDLDITYNELIKPTMHKLNIDCIRSDEVITNKSIDGDLYELLYMSDLVIADISTLNSNAIYELGVRHALKPFTTIIIAENNATFPFDINHLKIHKYQHDGSYISNSEIDKLSNKLVSIIYKLNHQKNPDIDSPLYTYLNITPPVEIDKYSFKDLCEKYNHSESIFKLISLANNLRDKNDFKKAEEYFRKVFDLSKDEYILKELALCIYKQDENDINKIEKAEHLILNFVGTNLTQNTELLATLGAIYKRKWYLNNNVEDLKKCIYNYKKSYEISNQYYAGVNYAYCLMNLAYSEKKAEDRVANYYWSKKIYKEIINLCEKEYDINDYWINATLLEANFAIGNNIKCNEYKLICDKLVTSNNWKYKTTLNQINYIKLILSKLSCYDKLININC